MNAPKRWLTKFVDLKGITNQRFAREMTFAGNKVEAVHTVDGETVFEFEITSNRPDTLSIIGLAREASAVFNRPFSPPKPASPRQLKSSPIKLIVSDQTLCPTYTIVQFDHVTVKPSSATMQKLLTLAGIQPVNNIVDITNYLMWETGQPMHAFDAHKITGPLNLRAARAQETITPLDHKPRTLAGGEIIIEDKEKLIDLAGLMGGLNSEISSETTAVFLHVPIYDPIAIRRASKHLALRTDASTRFEKTLDLTQTQPVAHTAIRLIETESGGRQSTTCDTVKTAWHPPTIKLTPQHVTQRIGIPFSQSDLDQHLKKIGLSKTSQGYQPPSWRRDLTQTVDVIEEVARLHGYNNLPRTLPQGAIPIHADSTKPNWVRQVRQLLVAFGYTETYSSTLISADLITQLKLQPQHHLQVLHPTSKDYTFMRTTMIESLLPFIQHNLKYTGQTVNLFEVGTIFLPATKSSVLPDQPTQLGFMSTSKSYAQVKGEVERLLKHFSVDATLTPGSSAQPPYYQTQYVHIQAGDTTLGTLGRLDPQHASHSQPIIAATLNLTALEPRVSTTSHYYPIPTQPPIIEDLTFTLPAKTHLGPIIEEIDLTSKLIEKVEFTDRFSIPESKRSKAAGVSREQNVPTIQSPASNYTFRITYRHPRRSLTDQELAPIRKKIVANLKKSFSAKLVGKL